MKIAILSTTKLPAFLGRDHPDEQALFAEDARLVAAFADLGAAAERVAWRRAGVDWRGYDLAVIRSTWDYIDDLAGFLARLAEIEAAGCPLINPLETVRWNTDKRYLLRLAEAGVRLVPTRLVATREEIPAALAALADAPGGSVLKPLMGVGAFAVERVRRRQDLARRLAAKLAGGPLLLQPFVASIQDEGEWSFVFGAGRFLYAVLKRPAPEDFRVQVMYGARTTPATPAPCDLVEKI